jgi:hypothetical protein
MSLYNLVNGVNQITFFLTPMLDLHPDDIPRFRDCFVNDGEHPEYNNHIHLYTRVGGGNRGCDYGEEELMKHPNFVATFDDDFDNTYASYIFSVPDEFKADFNLILEGKFKETSKNYQEKVYSIFPKIKEELEIIFNN